MNRRSLLLGSVVASVAGILGVKAEAAKLEPKPVYFTGEPYPYEAPDFDNALRKGIWPDEEQDRIRRQIVLDHMRNSPEYRALLVERIKESLGTEMSGYQVQQLMVPDHSFTIPGVPGAESHAQDRPITYLLGDS